MRYDGDEMDTCDVDGRLDGRLWQHFMYVFGCAVVFSLPYSSYFCFFLSPFAEQADDLMFYVIKETR